MWKSIKKLDIFSQYVTLKYDKNIKHKTILGGFCSFLLFGLAIGYFLLCLQTMLTKQKIQIRSSTSSYPIERGNIERNKTISYEEIGLEYIVSISSDGIRKSPQKCSYSNIIKYFDVRVYNDG